tara:strand:+ start:3294 stop:3734 length:441 start_codon:yes stop_codon:yes gene_type:complete
MRFETNKDLARERRAIEKFVSRFKGSFKKLSPNDVDYRVYDSKGKLIAYVEVKGRFRTIAEAYPLPVAARKVVKLCDKRLNPVLIWSCEDGIIYGKPTHLKGILKWGGRKPREGAVNDEELMIYYDKQDEFKYHKYYDSVFEDTNL